MTVGLRSADPARVPRATCRLQFHKGFSLRDALSLIPFLHELGISHVQASPLLKAMPASTHGGDVCDFGQLNPELGTEADLQALAAALRQRGMGLVLDIVPDHMSIGWQNAWWWDVLLHGQSSRFASCFDIDWSPLDPRLRGKVLLPILGDEYERVLDAGGFDVQIERAMPILRYFEHKCPLVLTPHVVRQRPLREVANELNASRRSLDAVLQEQHYRLACWRHGDSQLNYRRYSNIGTLAGIRVEEPVVFDAVHSCVLRWWRAGWVDGFRVDHLDCLRDPATYLRRLRAAVPGAWLVVEKILESHEQLPDDWPVEGTSGGDALNPVGSLFVDPAGEAPMTEFYHRFTGEPTDCTAVVRESQRLVLRELLATEASRLTQWLVKAAARNWRGQPLMQHHLREALIEVIACFPVYRTYIPEQGNTVSEADELVISRAVDAARQERPDLQPELFELIEDLLLLRWDGAEEREFVMRFQQLAGSVMAKGVEHTACYRYNRLIALNTVGGDPGQFGAPPERFHLHCLKNQQRWPHGLLAPSTHDTLRGEDARARLSLLSEIPSEWAEAVLRWAEINHRYRSGRIPDRNLEYFFYQTLVGAWPLSLDRAWVVMEKAAGEAKQHANWSARHEEFDRHLREFVAHALGDRRFLGDVAQFVQRLIEPGYVTSLAQTLLKLTMPGVPGIYQGNVLWDFSLADPEPRRPVDFEAHERALVIVRKMTADQIWQRRADGFPKIWVIHRTLQFRRSMPELFGAKSSHGVVRLHGSKARHAVAFHRGGGLVVVVPRLALHLAGDWAETEVVLPEGQWQNQFTGETVAGGACRLSDLLKQFPVALLGRMQNP